MTADTPVLPTKDLLLSDRLLYSVSVGRVAGNPDVGVRLVPGPLHQAPRVVDLLPAHSLQHTQLYK